MVVQEGEGRLTEAAPGKHEANGGRNLLHFLQGLHLGEKLTGLPAGKGIMLPIFDFTNNGQTLGSIDENIHLKIRSAHCRTVIRPEALILNKLESFRQVLDHGTKQVIVTIGVTELF